VRREDLLVALARAIDESIEILAVKGREAILDMFTRVSSYVVGRRVKVDQPGAVVEGITCGLDPSGFLLVRQDNGIEATILAGGVRPASNDETGATGTDRSVHTEGGNRIGTSKRGTE
jgi:biotin-(acetyl-CoA carboxylase) ligase